MKSYDLVSIGNYTKDTIVSEAGPATWTAAATATPHMPRSCAGRTSPR